VKLSTCKSCQAPIVWTTTTNGKRMPVDADPVLTPRGFRLSDEDQDEAAPIATFVTTPDAGERLYQSHFSTCPQGANWRNA
jgi:hypothetical protein